MSSETGKRPRDIVARARLQIARIHEWTTGMDMAAYTADERTRYAVERAFIALGEAIKDLARAVDLQTIDPAGPWREPARFRDFLAHDYDDQVLPPLVWDTITTDLPYLDAALGRVEARLAR